MALEKLEKELVEETRLVKKEEVREKGPPSEIYSKVVQFTNEARKQYGDLIKSVLIFGSAVRGDAKKGSDADVWVVLDDTATKSGEDFEKIAGQLQIFGQELKDVHVQTTPLTEFWQWVKMGSPELVNFLRYGLPLYDTGFIKPVQRMLNMGLIPPSEETIGLKARSADARFRRLKLDLKAMIFDLRYVVTDIVQSAVMFHYKAQPDQRGIPQFLEKMVAEKKLEKEWIEKFHQIDKLWKDIDHREVKNVDAAYLQRAMDLAGEFIVRFKKLIPRNILGEELPEMDE